eukprot:GHVS01019601.1.p1 GENE.GHVS01019601.1~~GHVS01019601.1.p1  ORF type:complete len:122 (-),score=40.21 GHVS01019601.1:254-571(-)
MAPPPLRAMKCAVSPEWLTKLKERIDVEAKGIYGCGGVGDIVVDDGVTGGEFINSRSRRSMSGGATTDGMMRLERLSDMLDRLTTAKEKAIKQFTQHNNNNNDDV